MWAGGLFDERVIEGIYSLVASSRWNPMISRGKSWTLSGVDEDLTIRANVLFLSEGILHEFWRVDQIAGKIALRDLRVAGIEPGSSAEVVRLFFSYWNIVRFFCSFGLLEVLLQCEVILLGVCLQRSLKLKQNSIRLFGADLSHDDF